MTEHFFFPVKMSCRFKSISVPEHWVSGPTTISFAHQLIRLPHLLEEHIGAGERCVCLSSGQVDVKQAGKALVFLSPVFAPGGVSWHNPSDPGVCCKRWGASREAPMLAAALSLEGSDLHSSWAVLPAVGWPLSSWLDLCGRCQMHQAENRQKGTWPCHLTSVALLEKQHDWMLQPWSYSCCSCLLVSHRTLSLTPQFNLTVLQDLPVPPRLACQCFPWPLAQCVGTLKWSLCNQTAVTCFTVSRTTLISDEVLNSVTKQNKKASKQTKYNSGASSAVTASFPSFNVL